MVGMTALILTSLMIFRVFLSMGQLMSTLRRTLLPLKFMSPRVLYAPMVLPQWSIPRALLVLATDSGPSIALHMDLIQSMFSGMTSDSWWTAW